MGDGNAAALRLRNSGAFPYLAALLGETGSVTQRRFSTAVEGDTLVVTLSAECEEQIGKEVPIAVSEG